MTNRASHAPETAVGRTMFAVFALTAAVLVLTTGGHTYAIDEETMLSAAYGVLERGNLTLSAGPDASVSTYGPGQSIAAAPLLWLALQLTALVPEAAHVWLVRAVLSWFNPLVTALTAALLVPLLIRRGFGRAVVIVTALVYALATPAWPHSKTFFAEPLTALLLLASLAAADRGAAGRRGWLVLAGLAAGLAPAVKIQAAICLPVLGLAVLWPAFVPRDWRRLVLDGLAWGCAAFAGLGLLVLYQWLSFGSPLATGYGNAAETIFRNEPLLGLYGLLFSPGKSLLLYAPPLLLLPWALWRLARRDAVLTLVIVTLLAVNLLFYARLIFWHGDGAWGPRYLNIILPLLVLPLAEIFALWATQRAARIALMLTLPAAIPLQLGAVTINLNAYLGVQPLAEARYFSPTQSPIVGHLQLLTTQLTADVNARFSRPAVWLQQGFSYSEGDRERNAQLPRWTTGAAILELRPAGSAALRLDLTLDGCRPAPIPPADVTLGIAARSIQLPSACPARRVQLLLAPRTTLLSIDSDGWLPRAAGIERDGTLGVLLRDLTAGQDGRTLPIVGRLLPLTELPADNITYRLWHSDYRSAHYDFWWWYLQAAPISPLQRAVVVGVWLLVPVVLAAAGLRALIGRR